MRQKSFEAVVGAAEAETEEVEVEVAVFAAQSFAANDNPLE